MEEREGETLLRDRSIRLHWLVAGEASASEWPLYYCPRHSSSSRSTYLLSKWNGGNRLNLFRADLQEEGSFDEAVKGCDGVFHVAAPMEFSVPSQDNIESYVQSKVITPAIKGTLNLLKSCLKSRTVKRVVFTSSISTLTSKDKNGDWIPSVNESCRASVDHVLKIKAPGWVYVLSKLLMEEGAFKFAGENGINLVSVITTTVVGPFVTSTIPPSIKCPSIAHNR